MNTKELLILYQEIQDMLHDKKYQDVNDRINNILNTNEDPVLWVGMPRLTFMWRKYLADWDTWVCDGIRKFESIGINGKQTMKGLY